MTGTIRNPEGERRRATLGKTIFDYADELAVQVPTSCYRTGHCHECVVEIRQGMQALAPRTEAESFLRHEYRLACQAVIEDAEVDLLFAPLRRKPKILAVSAEKDIELDPVVSRRGDEVLYDGEVIDRFRGHLYGLAIDLGTTTVVMDLVDLESGRSLHVSSFENPQRFGGSDIMNRISYDGGQDARGELQRSVVSAINFEILEMVRLLDFTRQEIYEIAVAGNSTMRDLLFKLDVQGIGQRPYKSLVELEYLAGERSSTSLVQIARRLGLRANLKTRVYGLPLIASHVGADTAAALVALDMDSRSEDAVVVVDVGTNTEVVVGKGERLVAASCPAGPAFEGGGVVKFGMPGYEGAIESFRLDSGGREFAYSTIGDTDPQGICGSGLIDLLAELRRSDRLTAKGVFTEDKKLFEIDIVPEAGITLSKEDISNLAQAKAANYCGQYIVMRKLGVDPEDVSRLYLAGGFANYVHVGNAIDIGFLAPVPEDRIVKVGNTALQGAREVLLNRRRRAQLEELVKGIEHVELETTADFFEVFVDGCQLKPMPRRFATQASAFEPAAQATPSLT